MNDGKSSHQSEPDRGILRRDAFKAAALLFAAPLSGETRRSSQYPALPTGRNQSFDQSWRFLRGDAPSAEHPDFDDGSWRVLDLPHDFSVEDLPPRHADDNGLGAIWGSTPFPTRVGPFDTELSAGGRSTGWFVGGTGWYRKSFSAAGLPQDGRVEIVFDGVYMNSNVWLNGELLGTHPYGYTSFTYDLTPHLKRDGGNVIAVRVKNEDRNSRWYSGSGIYRHVWLNTTGPVRFPLWGVFVSTPKVAADEASVKVAFRVENRAKQPSETVARIRLFDSKGAAAGSAEDMQAIPAGGTAEFERTITVSAPQLWSMTAPRLYRAEVELVSGGRTIDRTSVTFGIRGIEVDAEHGLRINGEIVKLKGGCLHHDNGLLGAAAIDRAEERRVELMKAHGFNAIRTSHNPPSSAFLDACDRLGMVVIDEAFDCWEGQKNPQDYHLYFNDWWKRDLEAMVLRDRNHPSVILWSIGNEIPEKTQQRGRELSKEIAEYLRTVDQTHLITVGADGLRPSAQPVDEQGRGMDPHFQYLDVAGYNYGLTFYEPDHLRHPARVILGTESYARAAHANWAAVEKLPYVIGDFVWTAMDYLGESGIGNAQLSVPQTPGGRGPAGSGGPSAPGRAALGGGLVGFFSFEGGANQQPTSWFNGYCGDIDLIGQSKPQWLYRKVLWGMSKLEVVVQRPLPQGRIETISPWGWSDELSSWTWPGADGKTVNVRVYSSGDRVQLLLHGKEVDSKPVSPETELKAQFEVPYSPGELKAVAFSAGTPIAEVVIKTAGKPAKLRLIADRLSIRLQRADLSYVTLEVTDQEGQLVPDAALPIRFDVSGAGELAAAGTANPKDFESFRQPNLKTFHGRALAIVRPKGVSGQATVRVQAAGFAPATAVIQIA